MKITATATNFAEEATILRRRAEDQLSFKKPVSGVSPIDTESLRLLHELQVHHIEMEMQNAELRSARNEAEAIKDKLELQLINSKIAELALEQLNKTLEQRVSEGVKELRKQDTMLLVQNRQAAMGDMINCIAHQWRQPLNFLGISAQGLPFLYESNLLDKENLDKYVIDTMQTIDYMAKTIDDFMNFFKTDKEIVLFEVKKSVNTTVSLVIDSLKHNNIKLNIITKDEPFINGYPNEYSQVLLNIILNAQDALLGHNVKQPCITVSSFMQNDKSVVTITDNAGGIPEQNLAKIFEPYFTTKEHDKGTGIGLFMAKTIIEKNMHGKLTVHNNKDGAEFRIEV
jgi:signal transduction histidine kinase